MTVFAGIVSRQPGLRVTDAQVGGVRAALSRSPNDMVTDYRTPGAYLAKIDVGAFGEPAFRVSPKGSVAMLAGEPLLGGGSSSGRDADLRRLHEGWDGGQWNVQRDARGMFCAAHYDPTSATLTITSDKLGVRPIYFWTSGQYVVFATALRILEALPEVPKTMDLRGAAERVHFGFPLGARTGYRDVSVLRAAETVHFTPTTVTRDSYWRWDRLTPWKGSRGDLLAAAHATFMDAVRTRLRSDRVTVSFLSGGLDSRCIVAALRGLGATVHTLNFSPLGTQDQAFAKGFAQVIGAAHHEAPRATVYRLYLEECLRDAWPEVAAGLPAQPERPALVWSGDGGSVGVGHVYLDESVVQHMRAGRVDDAIATFFRAQGMGVPEKLLAPRAAQLLPRYPHEGIREELAEIESSDRGNAFHLFLMHNDQRRHLAEHFENIDRYRVEYHAPFFDSAFLEIVLSAPLEWRMRHRLYVDWLTTFAPAATAVPWQAYPGHVPCPLPIPAGLVTQWDRKVLERRFPEVWRARERDLVTAAQTILAADDFPSSILHKGRLRVATWAHQLRLRDYLFVFGTAHTLYDLWRRCGGSTDPDLGSAVPKGAG